VHPAALSRSRACRKRKPGAAHCTGTTHSQRGGRTIILDTLTLVDGGNSFGCVGCLSKTGGPESLMIGITLPLASVTRFSFGCIAWTCRSMNWQPRMHSADRLSTTMKRAWTLIVPSCTVNVMFPPSGGAGDRLHQRYGIPGARVCVSVPNPRGGPFL
jgi:hypothetical protein